MLLVVAALLLVLVLGQHLPPPAPRECAPGQSRVECIRQPVARPKSDDR